MAVSTRDGLKQYCLRALGAPVLEINVDDDQLEDRIDEAILFWNNYHHEGITKVYLTHQITSTSTITLSGATGFLVNDTITGATSAVTATVSAVDNSNNILTVTDISDTEDTFIEGELITTGATGAVIQSGGVSLSEMDSKYIELPDYIFGVVSVLPFVDSTSSQSMFDLQYQIRLNDFYSLTSTSLIYYTQVMQHLALLDHQLNRDVQYDFNRLQGRLYLRVDWNNDLVAGDYIIIECYRALDPSNFSRVYNEPWLKHYTTSLFKKQWATNLKKFQGIQLPGGVTLDGQSMYQEAVEEINRLEEELLTKSAPLGFIMG